MDAASVARTSAKLEEELAKQRATQNWGVGRMGTDCTGRKVDGIDPLDLSRVYKGGVGTIPGGYPGLPPALQGGALLSELEWAYNRLPRFVQDFLHGQNPGVGSNTTISAYDLEGDIAKWIGEYMKAGDAALKEGLEKELGHPMTPLEIAAINQRKGRVFSRGLDKGVPRESLADIVGAALGGACPDTPLADLLGSLRIEERDREEAGIQARLKDMNNKESEEERDLKNSRYEMKEDEGGSECSAAQSNAHLGGKLFMDFLTTNSIWGPLK